MPRLTALLKLPALAIRGARRWASDRVVRRHPLPSDPLDRLAPGVDAPPRSIDRDSNLPPTARFPHDDYTALARVVRARSPRNILELGTAHGNTTANLCALGGAHVYTVNALPEQISGGVTTFALDRADIGRVYRDAGYGERVTQIYQNTLRFDPGRHLPAAIIDLAVIDACHDTPFVISDFLRIIPALRDGAVVLLHDTHPSREAHLAGSYRACAHLRARGFDVRHLAGTWWGYWIRPAGGVDPARVERCRRRLRRQLGPPGGLAAVNG